MGPHKKHRKRSAGTSDDSEDDKNDIKKKKRRRHDSASKKKRSRKKKRVSSSSSDTSSSESSSLSSSSWSSDSEEERKRKKKQKKLKQVQKTANKEEENADRSMDIPLDLMDKSKAMAPMTKEEWEKRQNVVRRIYDESTGRHRLIKGDGEVIEEIVSRERHKAINQQATKGDGEYFQLNMTNHLKQ